MMLVTVADQRVGGIDMIWVPSVYIRCRIIPLSVEKCGEVLVEV